MQKVHAVTDFLRGENPYINLIKKIVKIKKTHMGALIITIMFFCYLYINKWF